MQRISEIEHAAAEAIWHPNRDKQETPAVTTPQQTAATTIAPERNALTDAAEILGQLGANQLIGRLFGARLGSKLTSDEITHVLAVVQAFEAGHAPAAAELPQRTPAPGA